MTARDAFLAVLLTVPVVFAAPPPSRSGLDLASLDTFVRPQDDLYRFANGRWLASAEIAPDRIANGTFIELADRTEADLRAIIEQAVATPAAARKSPLKQVADFYQSYMDETRVDALGAAPLRPEIARIDAITTPSAFAAEAGAMTVIGVGGVFAPNVVGDAQNPTEMMVQVSQSGTRLPNRDYYLKPDPIFVEARSRYKAYLTTVLALVGRRDPARTAHDVIRLETAIAQAQLSPIDSRAASARARQVTLADLVATMPGFDWKAWARAQGIDRYRHIVLLQPEFFRRFAALGPAFPLETWKSWLVARHIYQVTPYLSRPFVEARFDLFGRFLQGQIDLPARWKRGVAVLTLFMGDALGRPYVQKHFSPLAKSRAEHLVKTVILAYRQAMGEAPWLTRKTKDESFAKLAHLTPRIGFPEAWRDYSSLVFTPGDLFGNWQRARAFYNNDRLSRATGDTNDGAWLRNVSSVNAYYNPALNEIVLPASLLQPPLFDVEADDAVNYGALGAMVGHEVSHAFDEAGRRYDARGTIRQWWTLDEEREYRRRASGLSEAASAFSPLPDLHVNGDLTLAENLADLVGVSVAYRAYMLSLDGRPAPVLDGFTGPQRFFLGYARMWRIKVRDDFLRQWLLNLAYSPEEFRTNGAVREVVAFHEAFGLTATDRLFRAPEERVRIW